MSSCQAGTRLCGSRTAWRARRPLGAAGAGWRARGAVGMRMRGRRARLLGVGWDRPWLLQRHARPAGQWIYAAAGQCDCSSCSCCTAHSIVFLCVASQHHPALLRHPRLPGPPPAPCFRYQLMPLHSLVAPAEQRRVFVRPPPGVRKIVMATNIGESTAAPPHPSGAPLGWGLHGDSCCVAALPRLKLHAASEPRRLVRRRQRPHAPACLPTLPGSRDCHHHRRRCGGGQLGAAQGEELRPVHHRIDAHGVCG